MRVLVAVSVLALAVSTACSRSSPPREPGTSVMRIFPTPAHPGHRFDGCIFGSPLVWKADDGDYILVADSDGTIAALSAENGAAKWSFRIPVAVDQKPYLLATPVIVGDGLVVSYGRIQAPRWRTIGHWVAVIDLTTGSLEPSYPELELAASREAADGVVEFEPRFQISRPTLVHATAPDGADRVYVSFGGRGDIHPWHGWMFEIDLDRWRRRGPGEAITGVLLTTLQSECPPEGSSGADLMECGGGIWSPAGPAIHRVGDSYELIVTTGNGWFDPLRGGYAQSVLRVPPGLDFDPECDADLCADFDSENPDVGCLSSCRNLFAARPKPGAPPLRPASGVCDDMSFWQCLAANDWDLGGSSPALVELPGGERAFLQPGKDGGLYMFSAGHLGTLLDRVQAVEFCGTLDEPCLDRWAGTMITEPLVAEVGGDPVVVVAAFMRHPSQPAGLLAFRVTGGEGDRRLVPLWQAPDPASAEARERFRIHPGRPSLAGKAADAVVWVVDLGNPDVRAEGTLLGVRLEDGAIVARQALLGTGQRYAKPLIHDHTIYVTSCESDNGGSWVEAYRMALAPQAAP